MDSRGAAGHVDVSNVVCNSHRQRQISRSYCEIIANSGKTRHRQLTTLVSVSCVWVRVCVCVCVCACVCVCVCVCVCGGGGTVAYDESKRKDKD